MTSMSQPLSFRSLTIFSLKNQFTHSFTRWIRILTNPADLGSYFRGIAANKLYSHTGEIYAAGRNILTEIDALKAGLGQVKPQNHVLSTVNLLADLCRS